MSADFVADPVWSRPPPSAACPSTVAAPTRQRRPALAVSRERRLIAPTVDEVMRPSPNIRPLPGVRRLIHAQTTLAPSLARADSTMLLVPAASSVRLRRRLADGRPSALAAGHLQRKTAQDPVSCALEKPARKVGTVSCVIRLADWARYALCVRHSAL
uniref:Uncharacterized protein n=1 Tax=Plectus sambesii TaxID=2011161 RepID=A0A914V643_9BILA